MELPGVLRKAQVFVKKSYRELRRANWPTKEETIRYTWAVIILSAFLAVILGGLDYFFTFLASSFLL